MIRTAHLEHIACTTQTGAESLLQIVLRFLPSNYTAHLEFHLSWVIVITGQDVAGWTLDGYVIPRLASGLYFAREVETA